MKWFLILFIFLTPHSAFSNINHVSSENCKGVFENPKEIQKKNGHYTRAVNVHNLIKKAKLGNLSPEDSYNLANYYKTLYHPEEYLKYLKPAAEKGHPPAQLDMGELYLIIKGDSVQNQNFKNRIASPDFKEARYWLEKAAERGDLSAISHLVNMYLEGQGGQKDHLQAYMWLHFLSKIDPNWKILVPFLEAQSPWGKKALLRPVTKVKSRMAIDILSPEEIETAENQAFFKINDMTLSPKKIRYIQYQTGTTKEALIIER